MFVTDLVCACVSLERYCMYCSIIFYVNVSAYTISFKKISLSNIPHYNFTKHFTFIYDYHISCNNSIIITHVDATIYIFVCLCGITMPSECIENALYECICLRKPECDIVPLADIQFTLQLKYLHIQ